MEFLLTYLSRLTLILVAVVALVSWLLAPAPQPAAMMQAAEDAWSLPVLSPQKPESFVATINGANLWGTVEAAALAPLNEPEWRFAGVAVNGSEKLLMVDVEKQPLQMLKAGDLLPGGATIVKINENYLCLSINGKRRKLELF